MDTATLPTTTESDLVAARRLPLAARPVPAAVGSRPPAAPAAAVPGGVPGGIPGGLPGGAPTAAPRRRPIPRAALNRITETAASAAVEAFYGGSRSA